MINEHLLRFHSASSIKDLLVSCIAAMKLPASERKMLLREKARAVTWCWIQRDELNDSQNCSLLFKKNVHALMTQACRKVYIWRTLWLSCSTFLQMTLHANKATTSSLGEGAFLCSTLPVYCKWELIRIHQAYLPVSVFFTHLLLLFVCLFLTGVAQWGTKSHKAGRGLTWKATAHQCQPENLIKFWIFTVGEQSDVDSTGFWWLMQSELTKLCDTHILRVQSQFGRCFCHMRWCGIAGIKLFFTSPL